MVDTLSLSVTESSQVGAARRRAQDLARSLDLGDEESGKLGVVVTELATNLLRHAGGGDILIQPARGWEGVGETGSTPGVEVLSLDKGPGIANLEQCLEDGYSTAGGPGNGLGGIRRLADYFAAYTRPGFGTVICARVNAAVPRGADGTRGATNREPEFGGVAVPVSGERVCGDAWAAARTPSGCRFFLADGLGHGPDAARASQEAVRVFRERSGDDPVQIVQAAHDALRPTRGAAAALADVDYEAREVRFVGVGNISGVVVSGARSQSMVSRNGIVGHTPTSIRSYSTPCPEGALLVMHSDGVGTRWALHEYPGLLASDPLVIAGVLYRDFLRVRDDRSVLVARTDPAPHP